jgi:hypothetical protein
MMSFAVGDGGKAGADSSCAQDADSTEQVYCVAVKQ